MSERKVRSDKGTRRKPEPTAYESWLNVFGRMDPDKQQRAIEDCSLIRRYQQVKPEPTPISELLDSQSDVEAIR